MKAVVALVTIIFLGTTVLARPQFGFGNSAANAQNFNTGIGIPGLFGARFGASNAASAANGGGFGGFGGGGGSNSAAAAQSVGAGVNILGIDLGFSASNANSASNGFNFYGR